MCEVSFRKWETPASEASQSLQRADMRELPPPSTPHQAPTDWVAERFADSESSWSLLGAVRIAFQQMRARRWGTLMHVSHAAAVEPQLVYSTTALSSQLRQTEQACSLELASLTLASVEDWAGAGTVSAWW